MNFPITTTVSVKDKEMVRFVDLSAGDESDLAELKTIFLTCFPEYAFFVPEIDEAFREPERSGERIVHQVIAYVEGVPAGIVVMHTNLQRRVNLIHFIAVLEKFRGPIPGDSSLARRIIEFAGLQAAQASLRRGVDTNHGFVCESYAESVEIWERLGYTTLCSDYAEPNYGRDWALHGEPELLSRILMGQLLPASDSSNADLRQAGIEAFLLDHYHLPRNNLKVTELLGPA